MSHVSPRQNRVDPWSQVVAIPARGTLMGNRGCLHDPNGRIVRHHQGSRWIICLLEFKGRKRSLMQPGRYTELFFLDEATALAAGHRPCAECQRARFQHFFNLWAQTRSVGQKVHAGDLDAALQVARWTKEGKVTYTARLDDLPPGVMVAAPDQPLPYLYWPTSGDGVLWRWDFTAYSLGPQWPGTTEVRVLTPQPTVNVLAAGYPVQVHPSLRVPSSGLVEAS
jgi:hypothetical protein